MHAHRSELPGASSASPMRRPAHLTAGPRRQDPLRSLDPSSLLLPVRLHRGELRRVAPMESPPPGAPPKASNAGNGFPSPGSAAFRPPSTPSPAVAKGHGAATRTLASELPCPWSSSSPPAGRAQPRLHRSSVPMRRSSDAVALFSFLPNLAAVLHTPRLTLLPSTTTLQRTSPL